MSNAFWLRSLTSYFCTVRFYCLPQSIVGASDRCSVGSPDSPVNYSGAHPGKTREWAVRWVLGLGHRTLSGAPLLAPFQLLLQTLLSPQLNFFLGLCWTLCTWYKWKLGKLISPRGFWWTWTTKIDYRKWLSLFPFQKPRWSPMQRKPTWGLAPSQVTL
jgi:hypothetical protein